MNCSRMYGHLCKAALRLTILTVLGVPAAAQTFSVGGKFGAPVTDSFVLNNPSSSVESFSITRTRYTVGPTFEFGLPYRLSVEADALYGPLRYDSFPFGFNTFQATTTGSSWEFPVLAKARFLTGMIRPFGDGGVSFRHVGGSTTFANSAFQVTQTPLELANTWSTGYVAGGGVDFSYGAIHVSPEVRYTRWTTSNFSSPDGVFASNRNSVQILIGVTFTNERQ